MRILPSQSTVMKRKVGSTLLVRHGHRQAVALGDAAPVGHARAAQRIGAEREPRASRIGIQIQHRAEIVHVVRNIIVAVGAWTPPARRRRACAAHLAADRRRRSSLARSSIHLVASVSAGPPWGGLYLKPPSSGGLCEGVITMPSASPLVRPAVVGEDGVRERRRRRVAADPGRPSPRRRLPPAPRARWRTPARRARACPWPGTAGRSTAFSRAVLADGLGDRQDVVLVERES